jgi:hypothetical protein
MAHVEFEEPEVTDNPEQNPDPVIIPDGNTTASSETNSGEDGFPTDPGIGIIDPIVNIVEPDNSIYSQLDIDELAEFLNNNSFIKKQSFPISLPLKVKCYDIEPSTTLWKVHKLGFISNNRERVINDSIMKYTFRGWRKPISIAVGCVWLTMIPLSFMTWSVYKGNKW